MCRRGHGFDTATRVAEVMGSIHGFDSLLACVASVSVRLSARSMHFSLFWPRENWGGRKKRLPSPSPLLPSVLRSPQFLRSQKAKNASNGRKALRKRLLPNFCAAKKQKRLQRKESPTETLATQTSCNLIVQCRGRGKEER